MSAPTTLGPLLAGIIKGYGESDPRSVQSAEGRIGPSDLGFCRNKVALMIKGVEQTDSTSIAAAQMGTAIHAYVAKAFEEFGPSQWVVEGTPVTATFPSGYAVTGKPDLILPDFNAVIDVKTVDGFAWVKREGTSQNHKYQRHTYTLGALQAGLLDPTLPVWVGNLYIDRSGKEPEPLLLIEEFDPTLTDEIDQWIGDATYAALHGEDASRDIPAPICEKICSYFTVCRGGLPVDDGGISIQDGDLLHALEMFVEARDDEKDASERKKAATIVLQDVNGTGKVNGVLYQVRNTWINGSTVQAFEKQGYNRVDVRKTRGQ